MTARLPADIFKKAKWIWPENFSTDIHNCYAQFRHAFELKTVPKKAPLFITADQSYRLYINGRYVCRGPARGFQSHWPYDEIDVADFLLKGRNVIAVRGFNPGRSCWQYVSQGYAGLIVSAEWGSFSMHSDGAWKMRRQIGVSKNTVPLSMMLFDQEHIDLRVERDDWMLPEYDDSVWAEDWNSRASGLVPWYAVEPRMIPMLSEKMVKPTCILGSKEGTNAEGYLTTRNVAALRKGEDRTHESVSAGLFPLKVIPAGTGRFRSYLIDFGRTVVGNLTLSIKGTKGGEIVDTLHVETIAADKLEPDLVLPAGCRMAFGNRLICRAGENRHVFFHPIGFRYLDLTVRDAEVELEIDVELNWIGYPLERKGSFSSSDADLEKIWEVSAWTQQCCALDAYVDTPWREQAQWWGDARVQACNTFHLNGDPRLLRRGIHCISSQTTPDGLTFGHAPTIADCILPDFSLIWILTIWDYYWQTGSLEPLKTHAAVIDGVLDYFRRHTDAKTGLVGYDNRYWLFLDWTDIFKDGYPSVFNLWLLITLDKLVVILKKAGDTKKAAEITTWATKVRKALLKLINHDGLMRDGITFEGQVIESTSIQSQTLAILANLYPPGEKTMMDQILVPYIRETKVQKGQPSCYWCTYVFGVLIVRGYGSDVIEFIRKKWARMMAHGTTFEVFDPIIADHSCSHAWSAHPLYHLMQTIGGLTQVAPEWKRIHFEPVFVGQKGGAVIPTPQGKIVSAWKRHLGKIDVSLALPPGVTATVVLPGKKILKFQGKAKWTVIEK